MVRNDPKIDEIRLSCVQSNAGRYEIDEGVGAGEIGEEKKENG